MTFRLRLVLPFLLIFLFISSARAVVVPDKNYIEIHYTLGDPQPSPITINFFNTENESLTLTLTKSGDSAQFFNLSTNTLTFQTNESKPLDISFFIPQTTQPGYYTGSIEISPSDKVLYSSIPVYISVSSQQVQCRLYPEITSYTTRIQQGAPPFTQRFNIRIGSGCVGGVELTGVYLMDVVQTAEGTKPIRKIGGESLGFKEPGDIAFFNLEFDVSDLNPGTYTPWARIIGIYNDQPIETEIHFIITVISGPISPITNITEEPDWDIPSVISAGETFRIIVRHVNPNLQPYIFPNEALIGKGVEVSGDTWEFKFVANKTGKIKIKYCVMYRGAQFGRVMEKEITVTGGGTIQSSTEMKFDFFPLPEEWRPGMTVSILCRDKGNNNIVPCDIYLNGVKLNGNTFTIENAGDTIFLSAVNPNYKTLDFNYTIPLPKILLFYEPLNPEVGDTISVSCQDEYTRKEINCTLFLDGREVGKSFEATRAGNFTLKAYAENHESAEKVITITSFPSITYAPEKLSLGDTALITLDKETEYTVTYRPDATSPPETLVRGTGANVTFVANKPGIYSLYLKDKKVKVYEVKPAFILNQKTILTIIGIVGIILFIWAIGRKKRKETVTKLSV